MTLWLTCNWQEKLELWWQLVFGVEPVGEIDSSNSAVSMDLNPKSFYIVGTISSPGEIGQVELNLIPTFIKSHGHGANERLDTGGTLVVRGSESSADVLVIKNLDFESEVFFKLTDSKAR